MKKILFLSLLILLFAACGKDETPKKTNPDDTEQPDDKDDPNDPDDDDEPDPEPESGYWEAIADQFTGSVVKSFFCTTGANAGYFSEKPFSSWWANYWPQAHGLEVICDAYERTGDQKYTQIMQRWLAGVPAQNGSTWNNDYYDDMQWNAIATLRVYNLTSNGAFYSPNISTCPVIALKGFILDAKNTPASEGLYWHRQRTSKNACSNGPMAVFLARFYRLTSDPLDLQNAKDIYAWEKNTLYVSSTGAVLDNIDNGRITDWIFTYNQGTFLGAATELYKITGEQTYLDDAIKAADYGVNNLSSGNVINPAWGDNPNDDSGLFNGIYIRYLTQLILTPGLPQTKKTGYINYLKANAEKLWASGIYKNGGNLYCGKDFRQAPSESQLALNPNVTGAVLLEAVALLERKGLIVTPKP